ncbi:MAG: bifunctional phosphopantothenoylcysteine decarboxylase/phosphopantothenate--cysteine ligase CoaBC [Bacteroidaceae bacterium]|nr:bifunctional phosphopantothenoylcysteine decarboxylase/phosphopantothenate--cysteine ligase CoaBC [Bacteroidaceae bacterium]
MKREGEMLKGKNIVLGVTGSIAAYKAAVLVRLLVKEGATVQVVMTPSAKDFITPLTLSTLSGRPVMCDFFQSDNGAWNSHVELGLWADAMIVAPATASTLGKMANGVADNLLVTTYLSMKAPVFIAPAMDLDMYAHPSTQRNVEVLKSYGNHIIEATAGELASHLCGKGRLEEPEVIVDLLKDFFLGSKALAGKKVLVTAGPTYEKIDPVRFIGNYSSGKMGFAIAEECAAQGAEVTLIAGPVSMECKNPGIKRVDVESACEMYDAAMQAFPSCDVAVLSAAVADYRPTQCAPVKMKRTADDMFIELTPNSDIAASLGAVKNENQLLVGFALETDNAEENARLKLQKKNLDFIVLNSLEDKGAGFACDTNKVTIIDKQGKSDFPLKSKKDVAKDIVAHISRLLVVLAFMLLPLSASAEGEELNANVTLNASKVQGSNTEVFTQLEEALKAFINDRKWTPNTYEDVERITCNFTFVVNSYANDGSFDCSLMVQASRPVYGASYSSTIFQYEDKSIKFKYQPFDRLEFVEDNLDNNLTAVVAFYVYMIIGMDLDSMGELGGSEYLNKSLMIANNAQNLGDTGWRISSGGNNRHSIIDDYMNGAMEPVRKLMYKYHRLGLDTMFKNADGGRKEITECFALLKKAYEDRPMAYFTRLFTEYKVDEFVNIYSKCTPDEKKTVVDILYNINPSLSSEWDKITKSNN